MTEMAPEAQARLETYLADVAQSLNRAGFDEDKIRAARDFLADQVFDRIVDMGGPVDLDTLETIFKELDAPDLDVLEPVPALGADAQPQAKAVAAPPPEPPRLASGPLSPLNPSDAADPDPDPITQAPKPLKRVRPRPGDKGGFALWPFGRKGADKEADAEAEADERFRLSGDGPIDATFEPVEPLAQSKEPSKSRSPKPDIPQSVDDPITDSRLDSSFREERPPRDRDEPDGFNLWPGANRSDESDFAGFRLMSARSQDDADAQSFLDGAGYKMLPGFAKEKNRGAGSGRSSLASLFLGRRAADREDNDAVAPPGDGYGGLQADDGDRAERMVRTTEGPRERPATDDVWLGDAPTQADRSLETAIKTDGLSDWERPAWESPEEPAPMRGGASSESPRGSRAGFGRASFAIGVITPLATALVGAGLYQIQHPMAFTATGLTYIGGMLLTLATGILGMGHKSGRRGLGWSGVLAILLLAFVAAMVISRG